MMPNKPSNKVEEKVADFVSKMRRMKTDDVPLGDANEQRAYNQGWDCATNYASEDLCQALTSSYEQGKREGWDTAMISVPNPNYSQAEVDRAYKQGVRDEREKWETTVQYNVDAETWDRIRGAIHALEKPTPKNN